LSKISIEGNASGTGTLTIAAPNTNSNFTLDIPSASGVIDRLNRAGNVLQVVSGYYTAGYVLTTSTSFVATGASASITPTSASSKILIVATFTVYQLTGGGSHYSIFRGATDIAGIQIENEVRNLWLPGAITYLDSPATTSSTTYNIYYKTTNASYAAYFGGNAGTRNAITLMEIAG
jgi:hypothetical protein